MQIQKRVKKKIQNTQIYKINEMSIVSYLHMEIKSRIFTPTHSCSQGCRKLGIYNGW